jgi:type III pantothenate kinase
MNNMLTLDMGNTRSKVAFFANNQCEDFRIFHQLDALEHYLREMNLPVMACSVTSRPVWVGIDIRWMDAKVPLPFRMAVSAPETVGADRLAAVAGAVGLHPNTTLLVVDAGTCITYEYVTAEGLYWGGAISPGLRLRYASMHDYTAALPRLSALGTLPPRAGTDTAEAMHSGVLYGFRAEIEDRIAVFRSENKDSVVIITGGDASVLANPLKTGIFVEPLLLHFGLNYVYQSL